MLVKFCGIDGGLNQFGEGVDVILADMDVVLVPEIDGTADHDAVAEGDAEPVGLGDPDTDAENEGMPVSDEVAEKDALADQLASADIDGKED
jgi:hypothetical protein